MPFYFSNLILQLALSNKQCDFIDFLYFLIHLLNHLKTKKHPLMSYRQHQRVLLFILFLRQNVVFFSCFSHTLYLYLKKHRLLVIIVFFIQILSESFSLESLYLVDDFFIET